MNRVAGQDRDVSILVRVKSEMSGLPLFWERLRRQTIFGRAEVIFLDSGSTDGTLEYLKGQPCNLYALEGEFNFGRSCNQIAALATTPVLVFLSGHVLLEQEDALERLASLLKQHPEGAAYLRQVPNTVLGFSKYEAAYLARRFPDGKETIQLSEPRDFSNAASAITRESWLRQRFEEVHGSEDFLWAEKHLARGGELFYMPQLQVMHSHNLTAEQVYARVRMNAEARGQTGAYVRAAYLFVGVYVSLWRLGASHREALKYAWAHGRGYI